MDVSVHHLRGRPAHKPLYNQLDVYADKLRAANNAGEIVQASSDYVNEGLNHERKDDIVDFARGKVNIEVGGKMYSAEVVVGTRENGDLQLYDFVRMTKKETQRTGERESAPHSSHAASLSDKSVAQGTPDVNNQSMRNDVQYSISGDNRISSVYGKDNAVRLFENAVKKENANKAGVYYMDKNRASNLIGDGRLQLPAISEETGLIHSIFDAGSPVNRKYLEQTETRQFKRWFEKSKVVDEDGKPLVLLDTSVRLKREESHAEQKEWRAAAPARVSRGGYEFSAPSTFSLLLPLDHLNTKATHLSRVHSFSSSCIPLKGIGLPRLF